MTFDWKNFPAWDRYEKDCAQEFEVEIDIKRGLSSEDIKSWWKKWGWNELENHPGPSVWKLILDQFIDMLVRILLVPVVVSFDFSWINGDEGR